MNPIYIWGVSTEIVQKIALIGGLIFIAYSSLMIFLYRGYDEEKRKEERLSYILTIVIAGAVYVIFTFTQAQAVNNRNGYLQVYDDYLVLEDNDGNARTYDYDEIENISLNKEMIINHKRILTDYSTSVDNRDRVVVRLVNGDIDTQGYEYNSRFTTRFVERLDVKAAEKALEGKVSSIEASEKENRQITEN